MIKYTVRYTVNSHVYETEVLTEKSSGAIAWVMSLFPHAVNVYVI